MTSKLQWFRFYSFLLTRLPAVLGRSFRRKHHENIKQAITVRFFAKNYVPLIKNLPPKETSLETPETLWQYWGQGAGKAPDLVQACFRTAGKFCGERKHIIIDNKTLPDYTDLPGFLYDRFNAGEIGFAHFADLVRLELLYRHGGYWCDATNYMTAEIPQWIDELDFFVFHARTMGSPYSFMQNCFIRSAKGAFLLEAWRTLLFEYWKNENRSIDYFQHQLMFKA
ncbi:MAG: capsular polysaccharide synthesis protein, partial [Dysgonamonadaceae bacterium]|nr:capsular polysaccharide synthesis protein [Dysgonamonadaceae bacterium]